VKSTSYEAPHYVDVLLSTVFSYILTLCSSLSMREDVSRPYKTTGKIVVLYILILKFFNFLTEYSTKSNT